MGANATFGRQSGCCVISGQSCPVRTDLGWICCDFCLALAPARSFIFPRRRARDKFGNADFLLELNYHHLMTAVTAAEQTWAPGIVTGVQTGTGEVRSVLAELGGLF